MKKGGSLTVRFLSRLMAPGAPAIVTSAVIILAITLPVVIVAAFSLIDTHRTLTTQALERRVAIAELSSTVLGERFDRLFDLGTSLATRVQFRELIEEGEWQEAVGIIERAPGDFPFVQRIFLTDPEGTLLADTPHRQGVVGNNFAFRDWYRGVSENWEPYLSRAYQRTAEPRYNLVAVTVPIKTDDGEVLGAMVLQVLLDTFVEWSEGFDVGPEGYVYFVDHEGAVAGHPGISTEEIVNFQHRDVVRRALGGNSGIMTYTPEGGEEEVAAFAPVEGYGWGTIVEQASWAVFDERDRAFGALAVIYGLIFLGALALAAFVAKVLWSVANAYRRESNLFSSIGDGVVVIDRDFTIRRVNKAAASLSGWAKDEIVGESFRDRFRFLREHDRKENIAFIEEAMLYGEIRHMENHTILVTHDGREVPVSDSAAPIFGAGGGVKGAVIIFRDVSREREMQAMRSDFAYASHQLRTPVNKAMWSLNLAHETAKGKKVRSQIDEALASMESLVGMVNRLLDVSRIDQGEITPEFEEIPVRDLLAGAKKEVEKGAGQKSVELKLVYPSADETVVTDNGLIMKALRELLENAVIYNHEGGKVTVRTDADEHETIVHVEDSGIGIPPEDRPLIFTKFFRGSNFDTTHVPGSGLGLYLARQYLRLLGGRIWFDSEEGRGTTFHIAVPKR